MPHGLPCSLRHLLASVQPSQLRASLIETGDERRTANGVRLAILVTLLEACAASSPAHSPHDEIVTMALSPAFAQDGVAFVLARRPPPPHPALPLRTTDGGLTWRKLTRGLDHRGEFTSICVSPNFAVDSTVFLTEAPIGAPRPDSHGVYVSVDAGLSWTRISDGMPPLTPGLAACAVDAQGNPVVIVAGRFGSAARSDDLGESWTQLVTSQTTITALGVSPSVQQDGVIIAGSETGGCYVSTDHGASWSVGPSLPGAGRIHEITVTSGAAAVFVATDASGLLRTLDGGRTFTSVSLGLPEEPITALDASPNYPQDQTVFVGTETQGVFKSTDAGDTWVQHQDGIALSHDAAVMTDYRYQALDVSPAFATDDTVFASMFEGLFRSTDGGISWLQLHPTPLDLILGLAVSPSYASDSTLALVRYGGGIAVSSDGGSSWLQANQGIDSPFLYDIAFSPSYADDHTLFATSPRHKTVKSTNMGASWVLGVLDDFYQGTRVALVDSFESSHIAFLGSRRDGVFRTTDGGESWGRVLFEALARIDSLETSPIFDASATVFAGRPGLGVSKSTDGGDTWQPANAGLALDALRGPILRLSPDFHVDNHVFAATLLGLFESTDGAATWQPVAITSAASDAPTEELAVSPAFGTDGTMLASVRGHGLFKSTDGGSSWNEVAPDLIANNELLERIRFSPAFPADGVVFGYSSTRLYRSDDGGLSWSASSQGWIRQENHSPADQALVYDGTGAGVVWPSASAGRVTWLQTSSSRATFYVYGTGVRWVGARAPFLGIASVHLDGVLQATVDQYGASPEPQVILFETTGLPAGPHKLEIVVTGQKNPSATGIGASIDAIDFTR